MCETPRTVCTRRSSARGREVCSESACHCEVRGKGQEGDAAQNTHKSSVSRSFRKWTCGSYPPRELPCQRFRVARYWTSDYEPVFIKKRGLFYLRTAGLEGTPMARRKSCEENLSPNARAHAHAGPPLDRTKESAPSRIPGPASPESPGLFYSTYTSMV